MPGEVLNVLEGHVLVEKIGHDRNPEAVRGEEVRQARIQETPFDHRSYGNCRRAQKSSAILAQ